MAELLQLAVDSHGLFIGPIGEHYHIIAIVTERLRLPRIDDDRAIESGLLLKTRMAVVPVGSALQDGKPVAEGLTRLNACKALGYTGHAVHRAGQDNAVPMDGACFTQQVGDPQRHAVALPPTQDRRRQRTIHGGGCSGNTGEVDRLFTDGQIEIGAGEHLRRLLPGGGSKNPAVQAQTTHGAGHSQSLYKPSACQNDARVGHRIIITAH